LGTMKHKLVRFIAGLMRHGNQDTVEETVEVLNQYLPSGSGFDNGTQLDIAASSEDKLVFHTSFHHMSEHGYFLKWTEHTVTITPAFHGINIKVSGRNYRDIKDYIAECFEYDLCEDMSDALMEKYIAIVKANCA